MYELNDLLREWAQRHQRVLTDDALDNAVHAVSEMLPSKKMSRHNMLTRRDGNYVVTDGQRTYVAGSFREAKYVMDVCHAENLPVAGYIAMYCEG
jgi:hypothetical protein